jgi:predicted CXXCH cytochrome family protein
MRMSGSKVLALVAVPCIATLGLTACLDENIVYQDRPIYDDPTPGAGEFVGYTTTGNPDAASPSCANCHVGPSSQWEDTDHAGAWLTLQASGHAQDFCGACHSVNELGNAETEPGGYTGSQDSTRYKDVQCESCHGPGLQHVSVPSSVSPLASMLVGSDLTNGCGECHEGTHHPFVEQWEQSAHGNVTSFAASRDYCMDCHSGNGALLRWGITANYTERNDYLQGNGYMDITCGVCHDPHGGPNTAQLRFPTEVAGNIRTHLCAQCHDRRANPDPNSNSGPHSPETGLLEGTAGYFFPDMDFPPPQDIVATHGSEANDRLCATCHVESFTVTDSGSGDFVFKSVGHNFNAIPCLDEQGIPMDSNECALTTEARRFDSCATSGCHGSPSAALGALQAASGLNRVLAEELKSLLDQVPRNAFSGSDGVISTAEGARFNWELAYFGAGRDGEDDEPLLGYTASATHNPFSTRNLLVASIQAVNEEYGPFQLSETFRAWRDANPDLVPGRAAQD